MPYNPNVPQALQRISATQQPILGNFIELNADFAINHVTYTNAVATDRGKHSVSTYVNLPNPAPFAVGEAGIYNIGAELFVRKNNDANGTPFTQRTTPYVAPVGGSLNYFWLPCGLQVKMGQVDTGIAMASVVDLDLIGTPYTQVPYVYVSSISVANPGANALITKVYAFDQHGFTIGTYFQNVLVNWIAIGL